MASIGPLFRWILFSGLLATVLSAFHDVSFTGAADRSLDSIVESIVPKRSKRETSTKSSRRSLFSSEPEEYDEDDEEIMGSIFTQFMSDSDSQLILDLDFFKHFFNYAEAYRRGMEEGHVDYMKYAVFLVEKMKQFDVSPGCIADMFHLTWTAVEYATFVEETKNCTDCKCTPLFQQKRNERTWIFDVLDAQGKVPSGILGGNNLWVGSWNTCRKINVVKNVQNQTWHGQYCMTHISAYEKHNPLKNIGSEDAPNSHCYKPKVEEIFTSKEDEKKCFELFPLLNFGVCVPDSCTNYDVQRMITFGARLAESALGHDVVCEVAVECKPESEDQTTGTVPYYMFAVYFVTFTCVMLFFGSLYDLFVFQKLIPDIEKPDQDVAEEEKVLLEKEYYKQVASREKKLNAELERSHWFIRFFLCYSVYTNGKAILDTAPKKNEINALHGMRVLSMCWIILGHTYYYIGRSLTTDNLVPTLINFPKMFYTQIIVQAPLAVDTFFFLSGLLTAYLFFKSIFITKSLKNPKNYLIWVFAVLKRYLRITPTYAVIMLLDVTIFTYISSGPFWRPIEPLGCKVSGWTNFLYLNNFLLQDKECCMGWTWYLANDMQFQTLLMPLFVILFTWYAVQKPENKDNESEEEPTHPVSSRNIPIPPPLVKNIKRNIQMGYAAAGILIFMSTLSLIYVVAKNDYPPAPILTAKLQIVKSLDSYWNDVYIRPYIRCAPFIVGILVGYILNTVTDENRNLKYNMTKKQAIIGWTVSTLCGLYSVFGLFYFAKTGDISEAWKYLYVIFGRLAFCVSLGWITFVCTTGNGGPVNTFLGWKFFVPLSRITFAAYLIHPIMLQIYNYSRPQPFHFNTFFQMIRHTFEAVFVSYLIAFLICLAFEKPFAGMETIFLPFLDIKRKKPQENGTIPAENATLVDNNATDSKKGHNNSQL